MRRTRRQTVALMAIIALATGIGACSGEDATDDPGGSNGEDGNQTTEPVTITVGNLPTTERAEARQVILDLVEEFEAANPSIDLEPQEWVWNKDTFNAQLAGETLPIAFQVPYTEPRGLIERQQIADITAEFEADPDLARINPEILAVAKDGDGKIYGLPVQGYTIALIYNRDLFEQAGLDPDSPPKTWDEVAAAAKAISDATGVAGYNQMTQGGFGGWMLSALVYSYGGSIEEPDGDGYRASFNSDAASEALGWLQDLRWTDDAMGDKFIHDQETLRREFAAGQVAMYIDGADAYQPLTTNFGLDPETFGVTVLPQDGGVHGTLGGGSVAVVNRNATPEERAAALKWLKFRGLGPLLDQEKAEAEAQARADEGLPVGAPAFPIIDKEQFATYQGWIEPYINTPQENFVPYVSATESMPVIPEPPANAQDVYNILSPVVQAVLTREDADIDALLADAEEQVNAVLRAG